MILLTAPTGHSVHMSIEYFQALIQQNGGLPDGWSYEILEDNND